MGAVWLRARADLRARWRSWLALALAIGLGGAVVLTAVAGAQRTSTAFPRYLDEGRAADVLLNVGPATDAEQLEFGAILRAFPQVEAAGLTAPMLLFPPDGSQHTPYHYAAVDERYGNRVDRPNVLEGRAPDPARANDVLINPAMADEHGYEVGDTIRWDAYEIAGEDSDQPFKDTTTPVELRVVGIGVHPSEVVATAPYDSLPVMSLTPAFFKRYEKHAHVYSFYEIRLRNGQADAAGFRSQLNETLREFGASPQSIPYSTHYERNAQIERAIEPQVVALRIFAALTGVVLLLVVILVVSRQILLDSDSYLALQSIGMSRGQLFAGSMLRVGVVAVAGAAVAVAGAILASPLMPIGPARLAEPNPGIDVNVAILGLGFVATAVLIAGFAAVPAWRASGVSAFRARESRRVAFESSSRLSATAASAGVPATATIGVRNAVQPGIGRSRVPVRSAIVVTGMAIALVVASIAFTSNLDRLAGTPRLYGWDWTFRVGVGDSGLDPVTTLERLDEDPAVDAVALANFGSARIGGREVTTLGIDSQRGVVAPTLLEGREPVREDEIVLGTRTMRRANTSVGDDVRISDIVIGSGCEECEGPEERTMRIVGRAVFPKLGYERHNPTNLGEGAATIANVFADPALEEEKYTIVLIRLKPDADVTATRARLNRFFAPQYFCGGEPDCVQVADRPGDISNFARIRSTALVLAGALAVLALGLLAHVLISSVRRRGRELAVLKTMGLTRRQISAVTAWQATTIALLGLLIGIPVGLALGSVMWRTFADQLGVDQSVSVPYLALGIGVPVTIIVANVIAAVPALVAARTHPASVLRSE